MSPDPCLPLLLLQLLLILLSGWLLSTLSAFDLLSEPQLSDQAQEDDPVAARLAALCTKSRQVHDSLMSGYALCVLGCGALSLYGFSGPVSRWLMSLLPIGQSFANVAGSILVVLLTALLLLVAGYCLPLHAAHLDPEKVMRRRLAALKLVLALTLPLSRLSRGIANGLLRLVGMDPDRRAEEVTEEGILAMVDMGEEAGAIEPEEKEMIENIFEFNNRSAQDVMTHRMDVTVIWMEDDRQTILNTIDTTGLSRFPVCEKDIDDVVGILNTRDYLMELLQPHPRPLRALLREAFFVPGTVQADDLFRSMQRRKQHMAIVTDEYGGVSGIVTMEDLLEEIVGNIYDEHDPLDENQLQQLEPNLWRISGGVSLQDISEALDVDLPLDEDYDTLGGLVFSCLTMIPGDDAAPEVEACGLRIRVERIQEHRVQTALVSKLQPEENDPDERRNAHE